MSASLKLFEMGYTPAEFKKTLQGQFIQNTPYSCTEITPNEWVINTDEEDASVSIRIKAALPRKIAMLSLPVLETRFQFDKMSESQRNDFLTTFFRYFHKGGG